MKREKKISQFGFFNIDKPSGLVSSAVVNKLKWLTGFPCGHMGTLDPLASGVLPVGVGNATRLFDYFLDKQKEYIAEFTFGVTSDTLDSTGALVYGGEIPTAAAIEGVLPSFLGEIMQIPPKYSAKSVNGRRGYDLARAGIEFDLPPKKIRIDGLQLLEQTSENTYRVQIRCGGGTYIRSLGRDIAEALGTNAVMSSLVRVQSGCFALDGAIPYSLLEGDPSIEELEELLIPTERALPFAELSLNERQAEKLYNGQKIEVEQADGSYKIYKEERFYGIAEVQGGFAKAKTKLC